MLSILPLAALAPLQTVVTVDPALGPDAIQIAVDAATAGDIVLVPPGSYGALRLDGKGLSVIGLGAAAGDVMLAPPAPASPLEPAFVTLEIANLPADQLARIANLSVSAGDPTTPGARVLDTFGPVLLEDLVVRPVGSTQASAAVELESATAVHLRRVDAELLPSLSPLLPESDRRDALRLIESAATLSDCTLTGQLGVSPFSPVIVQGGHGVAPSDSIVQLANTRSEGGRAEWTTEQLPGRIGHGLSLADGSAAWIAGGPAAELVGADGFLQFLDPWTPAFPVPGAAALDLREASHAVAAIDVTLTGGLDGNGANPAAPVETDASSQFQTSASAAVRADFAVSRPTLGSSDALVLAGEPGSAVLPLRGSPSAPLELPGIGAYAWLDLASVHVLNAVVLDAAGQATLGFALPSDPLFIGFELHAQALQLDPGGQLQLSDLASLIVLP